MDQPVTSVDAAADISEHRRTIELLFFAYRDFTHDADAMLARYGFGRAHHRVIYFVGRHPGLRVGELLAILKITKQSLSPVLSQLVAEGFIVQRQDAHDRRRRRLFLSPEAEALEAALTMRQAQRLAAAIGEAGEDAADGFGRVLHALINPQDRHRVSPDAADSGPDGSPPPERQSP